MPLSSLVLLASVYLVAFASSSRGIATLVACVLARGTTGLDNFAAGFVIGDLFWFSAAAMGFALVAQSVAVVFVA